MFHSNCYSRCYLGNFSFFSSVNTDCDEISFETNIVDYYYVLDLNQYYAYLRTVIKKIGRQKNSFTFIFSVDRPNYWFNKPNKINNLSKVEKLLRKIIVRFLKFLEKPDMSLFKLLFK